MKSKGLINNRRRQSSILSAAVALMLAQGAAAQTIPAFPGADGAAANVSGGRGGIVYRVTKTNLAIDDPARNDLGTLRFGLNNANFPAGVPRTIVFDVAGVFNLGRLPQPANNWDGNGNGWDTQSRLDIPSNVTLAGQTAPGRVIITGGVIKPGGSNIIIRNITVAPGYGNRNFHQPGMTGPAVNDFPDSYVYDAFDISGNNVMIDHVSTMYATDETISCNELAYNLTVQYSNISQGQNYPQADAEATGVRYTGHGLGSLLQAGSNAAISIHHNLYAHQKGRLPRVGSEVGTGAYNDFRNNVFYNWLGTAGGGASGQPSYNNFVGNFWLAGPGGDDVSQLAGPDGQMNTLDDIGIVVPASGGTGIFNGSNTSGTRVHHSGNLKDTNKDGDANDGVALVNSDFGSSTFFASPLFAAGVPTYTGHTDTAAGAFDRVLNYMGANWWMRDGVIDTPDERMIHNVRTGTGRIMAWADDPFNPDPAEGVEWRTLNATPTVSRDFNFDVEGDGLPGAWELDHGLSPLTQDNNGDFDSDGYTNLEEYLNDLAAWPAPTPLAFNAGVSNRYAQANNWSHRWQPSRYDTARITGGTVVVDAVGQHAGTLEIGGSGPAALQVAGGWVRVHSMLRVKPDGAINFSGDGALDLTRGAGIVEYDAASPIADLTSRIASGFNAGSWNGAGIRSSAAAQTAGMAIGIAEAGDLGVTSFFGVPVDATTVLMRYTRIGDANLSGVTDIADFSILATNFNLPGGWGKGDFDYSGAVGLPDFALLAANFNQSVLSELARASVPEPAGLLVTPLLALLARRR